MSPILVDDWPAPTGWRDAEGPRPLGMVTTSFPTHPGEIPGAFVATMAGCLRKRGHPVTVLTPASAGGAPGATSLSCGTEVIRAGYPGWSRSPFHGEGLPEALSRGPIRTLRLAVPGLAALLWAARRWAVETGPRGVLVGHWLVPGGAIAAVAARSSGVESTTICHSGGVRTVARLPKPLARDVARLGLGRGPFVATCQELVDILEDLLGDDLSARATVAPMPVPKPIRRGAPPAHGPRRLLFLGRLEPVKGLDALIEAMAGATDLTLWICGDGSERARLEALARDFGVQAVFLGVVKGDEKARVLSECHGFVLPSRRVGGGRTEGAPVSLMEAMSYELPVLATEVGGIPEVLDGYAPAVLCAPEVTGLKEGLRRFRALLTPA